MNGAETLSLGIDQLEGAARALLESGGRMQMAYTALGSDGFPELRYVSAPQSGQFEVWRCRLTDQPPSLATIWPLLGWYEREMADLYGIRFRDHPEPRPLVLPWGVAPPLAPALKSFPWMRPEDVANKAPSLPEIMAPDVQVLPFGPVRADVLEAAEFTFFYIGEQILHYHPHLFYKHRGMEARFEGHDAVYGAILSERVSAVGSIAHSLAYCQAVEAACGCEIPPRARWMRVLLAELERIYNHLHYLGHLCNTTTLRVGEAQGRLLEEQAKQINARLTGSRFLRGILTPGGLRRDLYPRGWLSEMLESLRVETGKYARHLDASDSHLDRLITTGVLSGRVAFEQGATGPIQRASGVNRDLRRDHPYAAYAEVPLEIPVEQDGDAYARSRVRVVEINTSIAAIQRVLLLMEDGEIRVPLRMPAGDEGLGWTESPRGSLFYAVHFDQAGKLSRVKIKSPSFSNWRVFPFTVHDTNMMDYAINEASFGLTIAGCAR